MIKLFIFPEIVNSNNNNLCPLVKMLTTEQNDLEYYYKIVTNVSDCDYILNPEIINKHFKKSSGTSIKKIIENSINASKKVICFTSGDFGKSIISNQIIMLRMGGFKSKMKTENFISAYVSDPYLILNQPFLTIKKLEKPTVGFVGNSDGSFVKLMKEFLLFVKKNCLVFLGKEYHDYQKFYPSSYFRYKYLKIIQKEKNINSDFIFKLYSKINKLKTANKKIFFLQFFNFYKIISNFSKCINGNNNYFF